MKKAIQRLAVLVFALASALSQAQTQVAESDDELDLGPGSVPSQLGDANQAREGDHPRWPSLPSLDRYNLAIAADYSVKWQLFNHVLILGGRQ
jgi:hypothetical protein